MPPTGISREGVNKERIIQDSPTMANMPKVQRGYLFLLESLQEEEQLIGSICCICKLPPLCDDERIYMRDGKGHSKKKELLLRLISNGENSCKEFLERFQSYQNLYSQFCNAVQFVNQGAGLLQDLPLTNDGLVDNAEVLLEEMEPSCMSDILFCYGLLDFAKLAEIDSKELTRRQKAKILLDKTREQSDKMPVFCHALAKTGCSRAIEYIRSSANNSLPPFRNDSVRCVKVNFRKLLKNFGDCNIRREVLFQYMKKRGYTGNNDDPKECDLIKAGIRHRKPGCDCIWELTRQRNFELLEKMFEHLDYRKSNPREKAVLSFGVHVLREQEPFFMENLEPTRISHILLEEEAFSVDDHDEVNNKKLRREKAKTLLDILERDGSELTLESFCFALKDDKFIMEKITELYQLGRVHTDDRPVENIQVREVGQPQTSEADDRPVENIQVREVGQPLTNEATETNSRLEVILSIPVEGNEEALRQAVEQLNINPDFKTEIAAVSHMELVRVDLGSVVLKLIALTDNACERLLDKTGENVRKMVEKFLQYSDLKDVKGNIQVTVRVSEEDMGSGDQAMVSDKEQKVKENWNMLVEELEPSILAKKLLERRVLNEDNVTAIDGEQSRKRKVECLLNILPSVAGIDAYDELYKTLHELGKSDIVHQIEPSENMHQEAEKVRYGVLSKLMEVIDEIESELIEETYRRCGFHKDPLVFQLPVTSGMSKSRREKALSFLMSIFMKDGPVLAFKNVLDSYGLDHLYRLEMPIDESIFSKSPSPKHKRPKGEILFRCEYRVIRKEEKVEDSPMTEEPESTAMDWESSSDKLGIRTDQTKPKHYEPKKRIKILEPKQRPIYQAQAPVSRKIFGRPGGEESKDSGEEWSVVVALDFGTTYSGYAFWRKDNPSEITPGKWDTGSKEVLESLKTSTSLLLNKKNEVIEFGFKAEKIFKELAEDEIDKEYRFFHQFKMMLHNKKSFIMDMEIEDHLNNPMKALDVFSLSIQYLKDECIEHLHKKKMMVHSDEIQWILTVPAIWDESAKQFMRKAAEQAGIPSEQLKLALEPEAAAIYVIKGAKTVFGKESVSTVEPGTKIMVADLGGGTADMTVLELNEDKTMKQLHRSFGGAWGGNLINGKIWGIMGTIFGKEIMDEFKKLTADFMEMESNIELKKRDITAGSKLQLPILPSLADLCKKLKGKGYKDLINEAKYNGIKVRTGKLCFEPDLVKEIFDLTLTNIYTSVENVLRNPNIVGIKDIILVGGFAQADFIVKQFKKELSRYNVIIPTDPVLAVLKGAVMFGQDINIISSRITGHTYGFEAMRFFTEGDPRIKKRKIDNVIYCVDLFEKMVAIGDSVDVGKTVEKEVFASSKDMKSMFLKFYQSDNENPKFVTDPGCECIGTLMVEMPDLKGGTERSVMVSISFGQTEITVWGKDKTTGKTQETTLNLLGVTK